MENELKEFIKISKYAGERFDIVQAGGGNSSVKLDDGTMLIKASGFYMSEIEENIGYARVINNEVLKVINAEDVKQESDKRKRDALCSAIVNDANLIKNFRPSIETLLHSMLKKYTLHTHPIVVNMIVCRKDWKDILSSINFGEYKVYYVDYKTPGLELAEELYKVINNKDVDVVFLQNHGMIVTSNICENIITLQEDILRLLEQKINVNLEEYKLTTVVSRAVNRVFDNNLCSILSQDLFLNNILNTQKELFDTLPFCPDKMVYCNIKSCTLDNLEQYKHDYFDYPRVVIHKNKLFFVAKNVKKAGEIEDVLKFHIMSIKPEIGEVNYLPKKEIEYIGNWEAEKYRQKI